VKQPKQRTMTTTSWRHVFLLFATGVLAAGQIGMVPPIVRSLQHDLGMSLAVAGMAVSIVTLTGATLGLVAGAWSERIGHARALRTGILIMALAAGFCAAASGSATLLAARGVAGAGYLLVVVAAPSLMACTTAPRDQPMTLSLWGTFVPAGIALAGALSATFADRIGWRSVFAVDAILLASAFVISIVAIPDFHPPGTAARLVVSIGRFRPSAVLSIAFFCFAMVFLALAGLLPAYLADVRGLPAMQAGRIVAVATAFGIAGSLAAGWLMRRGATPGRLAAAGLFASTAIAALAFIPAAPISVVTSGFALAFGIGGLVPAAVFASVPLLAADSRAIGPINGLLAQSGSLGSLAGPPLLALWVDLAGWSAVPMLLLAVAAIGSVCALAVAKRQN
jgi:MFS family permease